MFLLGFEGFCEKRNKYERISFTITKSHFCYNRTAHITLKFPLKTYFKKFNIENHDIEKFIYKLLDVCKVNLRNDLEEMGFDIESICYLLEDIRYNKIKFNSNYKLQYRNLYLV